MLDRPVSLNEAEAMLDARLDRATALRFREILAAWAPGARQRAFFSARVAAATALSILHRRCRQVLEGDMTDAQAVRLIQEWFLQPQGGSVLASMGFAPVADARGVAELASCARLALVIRTNVLMAQECGRYLAWKDMADAFPYGRWRCGHAEHHREEHLRRDGRVFRFDHPIWTQSPPGGEFNCRCRRELLTQRDLDRLGLVPEPDDFPFAPSSLGFDPSRPVSDTPVVPGAGVLPELAERALRPPAEPLPDPHLPFPRVDLGALVAATGQPADGAPPPGPASAIPGLAAEPPLIRPGDGDTPQTMRDRAAAWLRGHRDRLVAWVRSLMRVTDAAGGDPGQDSPGQTAGERTEDADLAACDRTPPHKSVVRVAGRLPEFAHETLEGHPEKWHDGKTNLSEGEREKWRERCRREAEAIQPGLWREADRAYAAMPEAEREALFAYTCRDLYSLNSTLFGIYRRNVLGHQVNYSLSDAQLCEIELLRRALDRLPRFRGTVYRCMILDSEDLREKFLNRWTETQDAMTGFMSTTYRRKNARLYMKKGKPTIIFVVKNSTRGAYIGHLSGTPRDEEILFDCNQRFRLLKEGEPGYEPRREVGNVIYITVTEVN